MVESLSIANPMFCTENQSKHNVYQQNEKYTQKTMISDVGLLYFPETELIFG